MERLGLSEIIVSEVMQQFEVNRQVWIALIGHSFLSEQIQNKYLNILYNRWQRLRVI